jgi:hypothetical protein
MAASRIDDVGKEDLSNSSPIRGVWDKFPPLTCESAISHAKVPGIHEDDVVLCKDHFESVEDPPQGMTVWMRLLRCDFTHNGELRFKC